MATLKTKFSKKLNKDIYYLIYPYHELDKDGIKKEKRKWVKIGPSKTEAQQALRDFDKEFRNKRSELNTSKSMDLDQFVYDEFLPWCKTVKSPEAYNDTKKSITHFVSFSGRRSLSDVNLRLIEQYMTWRRTNNFSELRKNKEVSNNTINKDVKVIRQCMRKALKWKLIDEDPTDDIKLLKEERGKVRFFTTDEINKLVECSNPYVIRFLLFGINTGMRMSEITNTRISDIDFNCNTIHIHNRKSFRTKSRKDRSVPIPSSFKDTLLDYVQTWVDFQDMSVHNRQPHQMEYLFCKDDGSKVGSFKKCFESLLTRASVEEASIHTMRHTYASHLAMSGISLRVIRDLLGHADIDTTMIYAHLTSEKKHEAVNNLLFATPQKTIS